MKRALLFVSCLVFSLQAMADDNKAPANHLKVNASVEAKTLTQGASVRSEVAKFKDKNGGDISVACKLLQDKKLDCVMIAYGDSHTLEIAKAKAKDTLVLKYSEKGQKKLGVKEVHLVFPGVDGV